MTYIWGTVGIILICKYLPRWWGVDAKAAAKQYESEHGVANVDDAGAHRLPPAACAPTGSRTPPGAGKTIARSPAGVSRSTGSSTWCAATTALGADLATAAAAGRRRRARRPARGPDREPGPDRPRSRRPRALEHPARPGRDPGHQQGARRASRSRTSRTEDFAGQIQVSRHRARRRADPARHRHQAAALRRAVRRRPEGRGRRGRRAPFGQDRAPEHRRPTC